jgi:hypothetical protein
MKVAPAHFANDCECESTVLNGCLEPELLCMSYYQRVFLLSTDIELNPWHSKDTKQILYAIKKSNDEVLAVRSDISNFWYKGKGWINWNKVK